MQSHFIRNSSESPSKLKQLLGYLPLSVKRHLLYLKTYKRWGDFRDPKLFSEKMQWRIINDRRAILKDSCDKIAMGEHVRRIAVTKNLSLKVPQLLATGHSRDEMTSALRQLSESGQLPVRWVLKPNNSSGRALLIDGPPDWGLVNRAMSEWSEVSRFVGLHWIWSYAVAQPGFIAEEWIGSSSTPPVELSAWMVGGAARFFSLQRWEVDGLRRNHYNEQWEEVPAWNTIPGQKLDISVPPHFFTQVLPCLTALGEGWDLLRIDLYYEQGTVWFGEMTSYPAEGLLSREGVEWFNEDVGRHWQLPSLNSVREGNP